MSRVVIDAWVEEIQALEEKTKTLHKINPVEFEPLETYLLSKYVDDVITALEQMKQGVEWNKNSNASNGHQRRRVKIGETKYHRRSTPCQNSPRWHQESFNV